MKQLVKHSILLFILSFTLYTVNAQVVIPDPNFKQFLINNYPTVINGGGQLDTIAAATITGNFFCEGQNISDIEGVQYFKNIELLRLRGNNLTSLPDLNKISTSLIEIRVDTNQLTVLPDISKFTNLEVLTCRENKLISLPSLNSFTMLKVFFCDNNQLTSLPDLSSLSSLDHFICSDNPLVSLPSFSNLVSLRRMICVGTPLTSFPDLSNCIALQDLLLSYNKLTSIPDLSNCAALQNLFCEHNQLTSLPYVNNCTNLRKLVFDHNQVTAFPNITALTNLRDICAQDNLLDTMPDLSSYPLLNTVKFYNNHLSFEDFMANINLPAFSIFLLTPQCIGEVTNINVTEMDSLEIYLTIDDTITNNTYTWYKEAVLIGTTSTNKLKINPVQLSDAGEYTCVITNSNPKLNNIIVNTQKITVVITPCIITNTISVNVTDKGCEYPIEINIDESSIIGGTQPFTYTLTNTINARQFIFTSSTLTTNEEGYYDLVINDSKGCFTTLQERVNISRNEQCDPVFYPNGDGIADTYFIEGKGMAKIYNREGQLIKEIITPGYWDGTTAKGTDAIPGMYAIIINEDQTIRLYLIR